MVVIIEYGGSGEANFSGDGTPEVEIFGGAYRPGFLVKGMNQGVAVLILFVILIDGEAKADIFSELDPSPERRLTVDPWLFAG
ncbi:hypothetical protein ES703_95692 [subsurface metagenome]